MVADTAIGNIEGPSYNQERDLSQTTWGAMFVWAIIKVPGEPYEAVQRRGIQERNPKQQKSRESMAFNVAVELYNRVRARNT